ENQAERTETRESNPSSSVTNRFAANSTREKGKGAMSNCHQATAIGSGESAEANASGSFLIGGSQPQAPSSSTHFNVSASTRVSTSSQVPATATATVVAPNPSPIPAAPASFNGPKIATASASAKPQAKKANPKKKPLPKFLTMPATSGRCWQDEAGNFHGLKHGRTSPASLAKLKKAQNISQPTISDLSCRSELKHKLL
ncbi:hypothetical protein COLO4_08993, partial [Corchorus olitorius]